MVLRQISTTFPINHAEVITYPATGDAALDAEAFRKWQFIRLPEELGGAKNDVSAFTCLQYDLSSSLVFLEILA